MAWLLLNKAVACHNAVITSCGKAVELCAVIGDTVNRDYDTGPLSYIDTTVNPYFLSYYSIFAGRSLIH